MNKKQEKELAELESMIEKNRGKSWHYKDKYGNTWFYDKDGHPSGVAPKKNKKPNMKKVNKLIEKMVGCKLEVYTKTCKGCMHHNWCDGENLKKELGLIK